MKVTAAGPAADAPHLAPARLPMAEFYVLLAAHIKAGGRGAEYVGEFTSHLLRGAELEPGILGALGELSRLEAAGGAS